MNIGKKLKRNFFIIVAAVVVLMVMILIAVWRQSETKASAKQAMDMKDATSTVRSEMMKNRLHLQNYLLSGDTRDDEKMNDGVRRLSDAVHNAEVLANDDQQRSKLEKVQQIEQGWNSEFASPLVDKRHQVDSGNATVAELQIFYLQKDPNSWVSRSSDVLDQVDQENLKLIDARRRSDEWAAWATVLITLIVFAGVRMIPGDPARVMAGTDADEAGLQEIRAKYGLNDPIPLQYFR